MGTLSTGEDRLMAQTIKEEPCDHCNSRDNKKTFKDESGRIVTLCKTPDCSFNTQKYMDLIEGEHKELKHYRISKETCKFVDYQVGKDVSGRECEIANFYVDDTIVKQQLRYEPKEFKFKGTYSGKLPFWGTVVMGAD